MPTRSFQLLRPNTLASFWTLLLLSDSACNHSVNPVGYTCKIWPEPDPSFPPPLIPPLDRTKCFSSVSLRWPLTGPSAPVLAASLTILHTGASGLLKQSVRRYHFSTQNPAVPPHVTIHCLKDLCNSGFWDVLSHASLFSFGWSCAPVPRS